MLAAALLIPSAPPAGELGPIVVSPAPGHLMASMNHSSMQQQMPMQDMLAPLRNKAFDVKWTQLMIDHHQMALDMAQHELSMGQDPRVKAEAQRVIAAQKREIATMQGWLKAWTGQSNTPKSMSMDMPMSDHMKGSMDRWFLEGMIPHHQGAIDMSRLIPSRTQNPLVRQLGKQIIASQTAEIARYRTLLKTIK